MRKSHILATVSTFALGAMIGLSPAALADNDSPRPRHHRALFVETFAYAFNDGNVYGNYAYTWGGGNSAVINNNTADGASGVLQFNQNAGPNSQLQNAAAVSYVNANPGAFVTTAVAYAYNWGDVYGNWSERWGSDNSALISGSFDNVTGVLNVNQNAGDNSLLQNSTALAVFEDCGNCDDRTKFTGTFAWASNSGYVAGNTAIAIGGSARATIENSGNGSRGVLQFNQNAGANSGLQNAASVASIRARAGAFTSEVSHAFNWGAVAGNHSFRDGYPGTINSATINNSFNGGTRGVLQVNQNAGDNSLLQNSTAIAAFRYCGPNCADVNLAAVSVAGNWGYVAGNRATAYYSNANATISNSFVGFQGVANVNQNAGANSLLQNATAVSVIRPSN